MENQKDSSMNILIVDDETSLRELCKIMVEDLPLKIYEASSGDEAWRIFQNEKIDLVITDINMPGNLDGIQLAERIAQENYSVPVLLVTGFDDKEIMLRALTAGVSDFILKPFTNVYFIDRVKRAMDKRNLILGQLKIIDILHDIMSIPKDPMVDQMSVQESLDYIHELVAVISIKKDREP